MSSDFSEFYKAFESFMTDLGDWYRERFPDWKVSDPEGMIVFERDIYECSPAPIHEPEPEVQRIKVSYALSEADAERIKNLGYEDTLRGYLDGLLNEAKKQK